MEVLIGYHRWATEGLLAILLINLIVPFLLRTNIVKMIFWVRMGYFMFWAFWTMSAFAGLITWMFTHRLLPYHVIVMIIGALMLPMIDGYRSIKLRKVWLSGNDGVKLNSTIVGLELLLVVAIFLYGLYGK
jgi:hypothetical protein